MARKLKWNSLLNIRELQFIPDAPPELLISDELIQAICWLTGATNHDRRLLRCTELGALLTGNGWDNLTSVETDELNPATGSPDSYTSTVDNKGVLIATSTQIVKIGFVRISGGDTENIYIPPNALYFFPYQIYSVTATVVPSASGSGSYVGITTFN